jgi:sugar phosphate isomerase/epimerase
MNRWCKLSILTDEVSQDLDRVLAFAREFRLDGIELRSLFGKAFKDLSQFELRETAARCADAGLAISACATPVFKCEIDAPADIQSHIELFHRSIEAAHLTGAAIVRIFTFHRRESLSSEDSLKRAAERIAPLLDAARSGGVRIGIENEASCLAGSGAEMARLFAHLPPDPAIGVVWDPCNVLYLDGTNDPVADDYPLIADRLIHVHVKDARRDGIHAATTCVELGSGAVDFPAQFTTLKRHGYKSWITLETHWRPKAHLEAALQHLPAGHAFSSEAEPASRICIQRLEAWIASA